MKTFKLLLIICTFSMIFYRILKVTVGDIFDNRNGTVRAYTLIVCETVEWLAGLSAYDGKLLRKLPTYNDIKVSKLCKRKLNNTKKFYSM